MNPAKTKTKNKRRRSRTSLSPDKANSKAAKKALELAEQLDSIIERLGHSDTEELNNSAPIISEPVITSSQANTSTYFQQNPCKNLKKGVYLLKFMNFLPKKNVTIT